MVVQKNIPKSGSPAKTSKNVSISTTALSPDPFPPTTSNSSAVKILDPLAPYPLARLVEIKDSGHHPCPPPQKEDERDEKRKKERKKEYKEREGRK